MSERTALRVDALTVHYGDTLALDRVSLEVREGAMVGVVGPNGSGKSTLLKTVMGLAPPSAGSVSIFGETGRDAWRHLIYVPQRGNVDWDFPITVAEVVMQGRYRSMGLFGRPSREDRRRVAEALERTAMTELARRQIGELSGGQQQRAFLARALAQDGQILLLDEPFAGVDAATERAIVEVLRGLRDAGRTVVVVHHDLATVERYFDHLLLLAGRVVAYGPVGTVFTPDNVATTYGGRVTFLSDGSGVVQP